MRGEPKSPFLPLLYEYFGWRSIIMHKRTSATHIMPLGWFPIFASPSITKIIILWMRISDGTLFQRKNIYRGKEYVEHVPYINRFCQFIKQANWFKSVCSFHNQDDDFFVCWASVHGEMVKTQMFCLSAHLIIFLYSYK